MPLLWLSVSGVGPDCITTGNCGVRQSLIINRCHATDVDVASWLSATQIGSISFLCKKNVTTVITRGKGMVVVMGGGGGKHIV